MIQREVHIRAIASLVLTLAALMVLFHLYNTNIDYVDAHVKILMVAIFAIVLAIAGVFILVMRKRTVDERSDYISSLTARYGFMANMYLMVGFMMYEIFFGIKIVVTDFIPFVTISIVVLYGALYLGLESYYR